MNVCQKCCKTPEQPILDTEGTGFFFVSHPDGGLAHPCLNEKGEIDYAFKIVSIDYEKEEGEQLYCEDCVEEECEEIGNEG